MNLNAHAGINTVHSQLPSAQSRALFDHDPGILADIYREDVAMTVWDRTLSSEVTSQARQLCLLDRKIHMRRIVSASLMQQGQQATPELSGYPRLLSDIHLLVGMFSDLFELDAVGLRVEVLTRAMCPKFHIDQVPCRLVTTYTGAATEWLNGEQTQASIRHPKVMQEPPQHLQAGQVALMKGDRWEGSEGRNLLHRSPQIDADSARLVVTMDFA